MRNYGWIINYLYLASSFPLPASGWGVELVCDSVDAACE